MPLIVVEEGTDVREFTIRSIPETPLSALAAFSRRSTPSPSDSRSAI
jgi:hypothetical protein